MKKRRLAWIGAIAATAIALTGCSGGGGSEGDGEGGTLTYLEPQTWITLYPPAGGFYPNGGVINPIIKLLSQFELVERATPFALKELGKISEGMAHGTGPQLAPKDSM